MMLMLARLIWMLLAGLSIAANAQTTDAPDTKPAKMIGHQGVPSHSVKFFGAVKAPREFATADLKPMQAADSGSMPVICASGATLYTVKNFRGVRLIDLINQVGLDEQGHTDARRMVILARATDGYLVTFSWNELFNTEIGESVLIAYEKDGKLLGPDQGDLLLISGKDIKTGPRHVRWLSEIEIRREQ